VLGSFATGAEACEFFLKFICSQPGLVGPSRFRPKLLREFTAKLDALKVPRALYQLNDPAVKTGYNLRSYNGQWVVCYMLDGKRIKTWTFEEMEKACEFLFQSIVADLKLDLPNDGGLRTVPRDP